MFGYSSQKIINRDTSTLYVNKDDYQKFGLESYPFLARGEIYSTEVHYKKKDGSTFYSSVIGKALDPHELSQGAIWMLTDITERKEVEERFKQLAGLHQTILDTVTAAILYLKGRTIQWVNNSCAKMFGYHTEELIGKDTSMFYNKYEDYLMVGEKAYAQLVRGEGFSVELPAIKKDGTLFWGIFGGRAVNPEDPSEGSIWTIQEITERKRAEEIIRKSLKEKEILLKELYHRTKNNMQVICSLLELKSLTMDDPRINEISSDVRTKIQTMALVHQKLYESQDLVNINLRDFVHSLVELILKSHALPPEKVTVHQSVEGIPISIDIAMPMGIVLNELITNSIKHAFPGDSTGEIHINIRSKDNDIQLKYGDNGTGLPGGFELETSSSLGLHLIQNISEKQLGGEISFLKKKGFACIINIKTDLYAKRV